MVNVLALRYLDNKFNGVEKIESEKIHPSEIKNFRGIFWLIIVLISFIYMILEPFMANI